LPRNDPFRTLDDDAKPAPAGSITAETIAAGAIAAGSIKASGIRSAEWMVLGALRIPLRRPGWLRRFIVRLVLGWRYDDV